MADKESYQTLINNTNDYNEVNSPHMDNITELDPALKLCYLIEDNIPLEGLVTTTDEFGTATAKSWINVKYITTGEIKDAEGDKVKLLDSKAITNGKLNVNAVIDEIVQQENTEPLQLALQQQVFSIDTTIPSLEDTVIHYITKTGSLQCVRCMLESVGTNFPFELRDDKGNNILHSAVQGGKKEHVQLILDLAVMKETGSNKLDDFLNAKTSIGNTALHLCVIFKKRDLIRPLLKAGVKLKIGDSKNNTLLHLAAERDDMEYIKRVASYHVTDREDKPGALGELKDCMLLQNDNKKIPVLLASDKQVIDIILKYFQLDAVVDKEIGSLIHKAAADDNALLAQALIEKNIDLEVVNSKGFSPLKIASKRGNINVVRVLLNGRADPNFIGKKVPGFSALNNAVQFGQLGCAKLLIDYGANLVHKDMTNTALHSASYGGHPDVVEFLIRDVGMNVNQRNNANRTPLYQSITQGHYSVAKVLLGLGADPNVTINDDNETLVHIAVREGSKEILTMLLEAKARPDEALKDGTTPLMLAVQDDRDDYIPLIMAHGITLAKKDAGGDTILHHIAKNDSCASAKYLLKRIGSMKGITQEFQLFKNKNDASKTPYDLAIECRSENVLNIFIRHAPKDYFKNNSPQLHRFYEQKLYDTLKNVISGLVKVDTENGIMTADMIIFEYNEDGELPHERGFYPNKPTLLHKLKNCADPELKYHPLVNFIVDDKLRFYRWWHLSSLISFSFFLICLCYALIQASTKCDSMLWSYDTTEDILRAFCELICLLHVIGFSLIRIGDFMTEWKFVNCRKKEKRCTNKVEIRYLNGKQNSHFSRVSAAIRSITCTLDMKLKFYYTAVYEYHRRQFVLIETIAAISFGLFVILRIFSSPAQWTFAGITFIFFSLSLLKYTRIFPKLGSYVNNILKVFCAEVPSFLLIVLIILFAFFGGIHLAARQQSVSTQLTPNLTTDGLINPPYPVCNSSRTAFFWFNPSLTSIYDLRRPLLAGLIMLLDGGPGTHEEDILQDNFFFTLIYLAFAFIIIVLMLNILIAQFIYTYRQVVSTNNYDYKFELLLDLELKNFFLFGKYIKKSSSIERIEMPLSVWYQLDEEPARPLIDQAILDMNKDFSKKSALMEQEFEKNSKSHANLRSKVSELSREVNTRLVEFGKSLNEMKELKDSINSIKDLNESINEIKVLLQSTKN